MKRVIIYKDVKTNKELCRDWKCNFIPHFSDVIDLDSFELTNTTSSNESKKYSVQHREISESVLTIYCNVIC